MKTEKIQTFINLISKFTSFSTNMLISFFLTPYLVTKIGKEAYSFYPLANNFVNYMSIATIALNSMAARFITIQITKGNLDEANKYFTSIFYGNVIVSIVLFFPLSIVVVNLDSLLNIPNNLVCSVKLLFFLIFASMIINLITNVFGVAIFSKNRLELGSICDIVLSIMKVILYISIFYLFKPSIYYVGVVTLFVSILLFLFNYYYTKLLLPFISLNIKFFTFNKLKTVISSGIWNSINQIGVILLSTVGLLITNILYGVSNAAEYAIVLTIPQFLNGIVSMLSIVFYPGLTIKYALGNKQRVIEHVFLSQKIIALLVNIPVSMFMAIAYEFFALWTPSVNTQRLYLLFLPATAYLLITSVAWPISNLNIVMNKVKVPALVMVFTGVCNILFIYATYYYTNIGIYSVPLGQMLLFILNRGIFICVYSAKALNEKWFLFYPIILKGLLISFISFFATHFLNVYITPNNWETLIAECVVIGIILFVMGILILFGKNALSFKNVLKQIR